MRFKHVVIRIASCQSNKVRITVKHMYTLNKADYVENVVARLDALFLI